MIPPNTMPDEPFGEKEPLFVLRARDEAAVVILRYGALTYIDAASSQAAGLVNTAIEEFEAWRKKNTTFMPR